MNPPNPPAARVTFLVPDDVPRRYTTAQLPPDERVPGTVKVKLYNPAGELVSSGDVVVDADGVLTIPLPDDPAPGRWALERGILLRSMTLLPLGPR